MNTIRQWLEKPVSPGLPNLWDLPRFAYQRLWAFLGAALYWAEARVAMARRAWDLRDGAFVSGIERMASTAKVLEMRKGLK